MTRHREHRERDAIARPSTRALPDDAAILDAMETGLVVIAATVVSWAGMVARLRRPCDRSSRIRATAVWVTTRMVTDDWAAVR
jgi:hypothetical protein